MIKSLHDDSEHSGLLYFVETLNDQDFEVVFTMVRRIIAWSPTIPYRASLLCVVKERVGMPTPNQRARLAEETAPKAYTPLLAVATTGFVPRALLTAVKWIQGKSPWTLGAYKTVPDALEWLEKERGAPLPKLRGMVNELDATP